MATQTKTNYWKVVHVDIPEHIACPVQNGYAVAWVMPVLVGAKTHREATGIVVVERYSGYLTITHAISQCNTLNIIRMDKNCEKLGEVFVINQEYVVDAV